MNYLDSLVNFDMACNDINIGIKGIIEQLNNKKGQLVKSFKKLEEIQYSQCYTEFVRALIKEIFNIYTKAEQIDFIIDNVYLLLKNTNVKEWLTDENGLPILVRKGSLYNEQQLANLLDEYRKEYYEDEKIYKYLYNNVNHYSRIDNILISKMKDIDYRKERSCYERTLLMRMIMLSEGEINQNILKLIDLGANINARDVYFKSVLYYTIEARNYDVAVILKEKGIDINTDQIAKVVLYRSNKKFKCLFSE